MNKETIHAYAIDWNGLNYEVNFRLTKEGEVSFASFEDAKAFMLVIIADLLAYYKVSHAAWNTMTREEWVKRTHKK